jgi:uncharacterized protein YndB with AHSA1/START domain
VDARCSLRLTRRYDAPAGDVWKALTDPASLERWLRPPAGVGMREVEPGRTLELDWPDGTVVRIELAREGDRTLLVLEHGGVAADRGMRLMRLWSASLDRLEAS